jgi:hypothetical protein
VGESIKQKVRPPSAAAACAALRDGINPATSAPGLGLAPSHICTGTWATPLPRLHRDWASPFPHLRRDRARPCAQVTALQAIGPLQRWPINALARLSHYFVLKCDYQYPYSDYQYPYSDYHYPFRARATSYLYKEVARRAECAELCWALRRAVLKAFGYGLTARGPLACSQSAVVPVMPASSESSASRHAPCNMSHGQGSAVRQAQRLRIVGRPTTEEHMPCCYARPYERIVPSRRSNRRRTVNVRA